jgi:hypothetical protein
MVSALDYIASVNASASQLSHVQPLTVQDVYALVTLMGLYLSEASGHHIFLLGAYRTFPSEDSSSGGLLFRFCFSLRMCLEG